MCVQLYSWALDLYQTLLNYVGHRGVICYSFVCLTDQIGQLLRMNHPDRVPITTDMHRRTLKNATKVMQELESGTKDFIGVKFSLMSIFDGIQCQQMVKGVTPHTAIKSERYKQEHKDIIGDLHAYADMRKTEGAPCPY